MASVRLDFVPPTQMGMVALLVEESPAKEGSFSEIDRVTTIGTYPNYISYYTTDNATDQTYWFRIRWEGSDGIFSPYSEALQGGTKTLIQEIVDRVLLRNPNLNEVIVTQEAQAVVAQIFPGQDPNSILVEAATYPQIRGMTNLTLARSLIATYLGSGGGSVAKYTAGLVALQTGVTGADPTKAIEALIASANEDLNLRYSVILLMKAVDDCGVGNYCYPSGALHGVDLTRTTVMVDYA